MAMRSAHLSGTQHALRAGDYEAVIASVGASLRSLTFDGRDLVVPFDADEVRPSYRGATLAPWPNRVVDGRYTFGGVERQVALTEPARHHALHGLAGWLDYQAIDKGPSHVTLAATIEPQTGYPWRVIVETTFSLDADGADPDGAARPTRARMPLRGAPGRTRTWWPARDMSTTGRSNCPPARCSPSRPIASSRPSCGAVDADDAERFDFREAASDREDRARPRLHGHRARRGGFAAVRVRSPRPLHSPLTRRAEPRRVGRPARASRWCGMPPARGCRSTRPTRATGKPGHRTASRSSR